MLCLVYTQCIYNEISLVIASSYFLNLSAISASLGVQLLKRAVLGACTVQNFIPQSHFWCLQKQAAAK